MIYKFLIDECLSPALVTQAVAAGHVESTCVRDRGLSGTKDWRLVEWAIKGNFTLVTHNACDFRGGGRVLPGGYYNLLDIHPGLICLNSIHVMSVPRQRRLFQHALDVLSERPDLINASLEVSELPDGAVTVDIYGLP